MFEACELIPRFVINFPTKQHWCARSRLADIETGLSALVAEIERHRIHSIALPPLGCGLGGLEWVEVSPAIAVCQGAARTLRGEPASRPSGSWMVTIWREDGKGRDRTDEPLNLIPRAIREAEAFLGQHPETRNRFDRVVGLVAGFESPFGLELLASVHWVATRDGRRACDV